MMQLAKRQAQRASSREYAKILDEQCERTKHARGAQRWFDEYAPVPTSAGGKIFDNRVGHVVVHTIGTSATRPDAAGICFSLEKY